MKPKIGDTVQFKKSGITGTVERIIRGVCVVKTSTSRLSAWPEDLIIVGLSEVTLDKEMEEHQKLCNEIMSIQEIEPIEAEMEEVWHCPEGYQFVDENGNVINATKIVLEKKKEYPKTYEECLKVLGIEGGRLMLYNGDITQYERELYNKMNNLSKLLICRDAYWKIAGEEMGLGKPWEPDWSHKFGKYSAVLAKDIYTIAKVEWGYGLLAFPTPEMRDAFHENFKELIEQCNVKNYYDLSNIVPRKGL